MNTHRELTISGLKWNLVDKVVSQGVGFVVNILLARLLLPEDFGLLGMVLVVIGFAAVFKDFGLGSAIVQKKNLTQDDLSTVFWFNLLIGSMLMVLIYFCAPLVAAYYSLPNLQPVAELLSVTYFIGALNIVQLSMLRRALNFRKIFFVNATATIVSGIVAMVLALIGWGVWSLVWKIITFSLMTNVALWISSKWLPNVSWSSNSLRSVMGFSLPLLGTQSLNYWVRNADNLLIGKYLGEMSLGFYNQSYRIMLIPVRQITGVVSNVLFPSLAQIQDDKARIKAIYLKVARVLSFITFPLMFGLCALAEPFVEVVLGEQWMPMVPVLCYLSIVGAFQSIGTLSGNIFQASGETAYQFWVGLPQKIFVLLAIVLGLSKGIEAVALYYLIATLISNPYSYHFMGKLIDLSLGQIYLNFIRSLVLSILMALVVYWSHNHYELLSSSPIIGLCFGIVVGAALYFSLSYLFNRSTFEEVRLLLKKQGV